jgi:energy-coupling factor transporter ATP-binding protein EcfA2
MISPPVIRIIRLGVAFSMYDQGQEPHPQPTTSEATARAAIVAWSADCPTWQKDALRRLCSKNRLDETDLTALLAICKGDTSTAQSINSSHVRDPAAGAAIVTLRSLHSIKHVNALADGECLTFDKIGVTIIYGDNGSGKSGYARVLKKVCRARSPKLDPILPNIYANDDGGTPSATVEFCVGGQRRVATWSGAQTPDPMLSAVSVFDSRTASIHVDQTNDVAYTPLPLRMLAGLAQACQDLKQKLSAEIKALEQQKPAVLVKPECQAATPVGKLIAALSAKTKPDTVTALAAMSSAEKARLEALRADLAGDPVRAARQLQTLKTRLDTMVRRLESLFSVAADGQMIVLRAAADALAVASDAAKAASTDLFSGDPLPDIGSETWKTLWEAARAYSTMVYPEQPFPATGSEERCVLCQQDLSPAAADRLRRFEAFIKDESKRREDEARAALRQVILTFEQARFPVAELVQQVALLRDELGNSDLATAYRHAALRLLWRVRAILRARPDERTKPFPTMPEPPLASLRTASADLQTRSAALLAEKDSEARKALVTERDALTDRAWLSLVKDDVLAQIERLKAGDALGKAVKETATNRITAKSSELAQTLVTNMLRSRFAMEVDRIGIASLAIELRPDKTTQGVPFFRVSLMNRPDQKVGDVLSEGEHRCVALAAFMAELATVNSHSAIVFDDPVSSLDHMHRERVAARLAEEGLNRQIVVFTHDIAFLFLLHEACRANSTHTAFRSINRGKDYVGFCQPNPPPKAQPLDKVIEAIRRQLDDRKIHYERGNQEEWYRTVRSLQEQMRTAWERAVEEALAPVIKRLANKVDTKGLPKITVLEMPDCQTMREAFGRCSELLHSESEALNTPLPPPQRIETEIAALAGWIASIRQRQDKATLPA